MPGKSCATGVPDPASPPVAPSRATNPSGWRTSGPRGPRSAPNTACSGAQGHQAYSHPQGYDSVGEHAVAVVVHGQGEMAGGPGRPRQHQRHHDDGRARQESARGRACGEAGGITSGGQGHERRTPAARNRAGPTRSGKPRPPAAVCSEKPETRGVVRSRAPPSTATPLQPSTSPSRSAADLTSRLRPSHYRLGKSGDLGVSRVWWETLPRSLQEAHPGRRRSRPR
jgi:hypothetical protein